jgi:hypothetical protein
MAGPLLELPVALVENGDHLVRKKPDGNQVRVSIRQLHAAHNVFPILLGELFEPPNNATDLAEVPTVSKKCAGIIICGGILEKVFDGWIE